MGIFKDVVDVAASIDTKNTIKELREKNKTSISKMAQDGTLQFPVIVSRATDIDTLQMVSKALERQYATFVEIAISMNSTMNISKTTNPSEFVRKFHQNANSMFPATDTFRDWNLESVYTILEDENTIMLSGIYEGSTSKIIIENKNQLIDLLDHVRCDKLNDKYKPSGDGLYTFKNAELNIKYNSVTEAKKTNNNIDSYRLTRMADVEKNKINNAMLKDNDVKKSNELVATTLHIRVTQVNKNDEPVGVIDFMIGIKTIMHPVSSDEMMENIVAACNENRKAFNFLRWTTGEIGFFKDFLFNIDGIKRDVSNRSSGSSPWWITLKRRGKLANVKNKVPTSKNLLPNATIVLSLEEVEQIKAENGFDLFNTYFINKIMKDFFLLGFVIIDNSSQMAHFMFDGRHDFETVTFSALEHENTASEKKFKEMLKYINRN